MSLGYHGSYFLCMVWHCESYHAKLRATWQKNTEGFGKKINDISEDTVIDLDGAEEEGCVKTLGSM